MCDVSAFTLVPQAVMTETGDRLLGTLPAILQTAVLGESSEMPAGLVPVKGHDFNKGVDLNEG
jgi:hypothetical protein